MKAQEIKGTIILSNGEEAQFNIYEDCGWQQWGNTREVHSEAVDILETMTRALGDEGLMGSSDDDEEDEETVCDVCGGDLSFGGVCCDDACTNNIDFGEMR